MFPEDFVELILMIALLIVGSVVYAVATRNRGSFADTPDWSKVVRRIIEFASVILAVLFIGFTGWNASTSIRVAVITIPLTGIGIGLCSLFLINAEERAIKAPQPGPSRENQATTKGFANRLTEHLINTVILTLFFLSTLLIFIITMARIWGWMDVVCYCIVLLDTFLSLELAALLYHIFRLILIDNLPSAEIAQILKIYKELDS